MNFAENLKKLRIHKNITQQHLGNILNLSRTAISNYENGRLEPSIHTLMKIAKFFDISVDELLK